VELGGDRAGRRALGTATELIQGYIVFSNAEGPMDTPTMDKIVNALMRKYSIPLSDKDEVRSQGYLGIAQALATLEKKDEINEDTEFTYVWRASQRTMVHWLYQRARERARLRHLISREKDASPKRANRTGGHWMVAGQANPQDGQGELAELMSRLTRKQQQVLLMYFVDGLTYAEIGSRLGITKQAAHISLSAAILRLREMYRRRGYHISPDVEKDRYGDQPVERVLQLGDTMAQ
jgi:RNA polymerase sigma factor (sigma-70 family)